LEKITVEVLFNWGGWGLIVFYFLIAVEIRKDGNWDWFDFENAENRTNKIKNQLTFTLLTQKYSL
jgi:hypothetical protein